MEHIGDHMKKIRNRKREKVNRFDENGMLRKTGAELRSWEKALEVARRPAYSCKYNLKKVCGLEENKNE